MPASLLERLGELTDPAAGAAASTGSSRSSACAGSRSWPGTPPRPPSPTSAAAATAFGHARGFTRGTMPCPNTITNLLAALDPDHLDRVIREWLACGTWPSTCSGGRITRAWRPPPE